MGTEELLNDRVALKLGVKCFVFLVRFCLHEELPEDGTSGHFWMLTQQILHTKHEQGIVKVVAHHLSKQPH